MKRSRSLEQLCDALQDFDAVTCVDSTLEMEDFVVEFNIEGTDLAWRTLEAISWLCTVNELHLTPLMPDQSDPIVFRLTGDVEQLLVIAYELEDLASKIARNQPRLD